MARLSIATAVALASTILAQTTNQPPPVPEDAQIGALHFPITCLILGSLNQTFDVLFTGTAPAYGGAGEEVYFTDTAGYIEIPESLLAYAHELNASYAVSNFSVNINVTNAEPASLLAFSSVVNVSLPATGGTTLRFPPGNGTLPAVGPFTLDEPEIISRILLGNTDVSMILYTAAGTPASGPIDITCGQQNIEYILGSVSVDNSTGNAPFAPSNGYVPAFPPVPLNMEYGFFRFPYPCDFGVLGQQTLDLTIGGALPTYFNPGQEFYLTESEAFLRLGPSVVNSVKQAYPNATQLYNVITRFDVLFSAASPNAFNVASPPLISIADICEYDGASDLVVPIPQSGNLTIGPVTAGTNGDIVSIAVGNTTATTEVKDEDGNILLSVPVTCAPLAYLELIGIAITNQKPDNYSFGTNENSNSTASKRSYRDTRAQLHL